MTFTDPTNMTPPSMASVTPGVTGSANPLQTLSPTDLQQIIAALGAQNQQSQAGLLGNSQLNPAMPMPNAGPQTGSLGTPVQNGIQPQAYGQMMMNPMGMMG